MYMVYCQVSLRYIQLYATKPNQQHAHHQQDIAELEQRSKKNKQIAIKRGRSS